MRRFVVILAALATVAVVGGGLLLRARLEGAGDEARALDASAGLARREAAALILAMDRGARLALADHAKCGDLACPAALAVSYRYLAWDAALGGYRLAVRFGAAPERTMVVPFAADATLEEPERMAPRPEGPLAAPAAAAMFAAAPTAAPSAWLADTIADRDQSEAPSIAASGGKASRDGAILRLGLGDGRHLALPDDLACGQIACPARIFRAFSFLGASPGGRFHAVAEHWSEASDALLVDANDGAVTALLGPPVFSPEGARAAASVTDLEWAAKDRLEVWSLTGAAPAPAFRLAAEAGDDTVWEIVGWDDADHLRLRHGVWGGAARNLAMLVHDETGWHIEGGN
jgi:hypothetical protein